MTDFRDLGSCGQREISLAHGLTLRSLRSVLAFSVLILAIGPVATLAQGRVVEGLASSMMADQNWSAKFFDGRIADEDAAGSSEAEGGAAEPQQAREANEAPYQLERADTHIRVRRDASWVSEDDYVISPTSAKSREQFANFRWIAETEDFSSELIEASVIGASPRRVDRKFILLRPMGDQREGVRDAKVFFIPFGRLDSGEHVRIRVRRKSKPNSLIRGYFFAGFKYGSDVVEKTGVTQVESEIPLFLHRTASMQSDQFDWVTERLGQSGTRVKVKILRPVLRRQVEPMAPPTEIGHLRWTLSTEPNFMRLNQILAPKYEKVLQGQLPMPLQQIVRQAQGMATPREKILAVISGVQALLTYSGDWRGNDRAFVPRSLSESIQRRSGDCKDFASLTVAALRRMGLEADVTLVDRSESAQDRLIMDSPPQNGGLTYFNHAIVSVVINGRRQYFDPTNQVAWADGLWSDLAYSWAWTLKASSASKASQVKGSRPTSSAKSRAEASASGATIIFERIMPQGRASSIQMQSKLFPAPRLAPKRSEASAPTQLQTPIDVGFDVGFEIVGEVRGPVAAEVKNLMFRAGPELSKQMLSQFVSLPKGRVPSLKLDTDFNDRNAEILKFTLRGQAQSLIDPKDRKVGSFMITPTPRYLSFIALMALPRRAPLLNLDRVQYQGRVSVTGWDLVNETEFACFAWAPQVQVERDFVKLENGFEIFENSSVQPFNLRPQPQPLLGTRTEVVDTLRCGEMAAAWVRPQGQGLPTISWKEITPEVSDEEASLLSQPLQQLSLKAMRDHHPSPMVWEPFRVRLWQVARRALHRNPQDLEAKEAMTNAILSSLYIESGNIRPTHALMAKEYLRLFDAEQSQDVRVQRLHARYHDLTASSQQALEIRRKVYEQTKLLRDAILLANLLSEEGDAAGAKAVLLPWIPRLEAPSADPELKESLRASAYQALTYVFVRAREWESGMEHFAKANKMLPRDAWFRSNIGYQLLMNQKFEIAALTFADALQHMKFPAAINGLKESTFRALLHRLSNSDPSTPTSVFHNDKILDRLTPAIARLEEVDPQNPSVSLHRTLISMRSGLKTQDQAKVSAGQQSLRALIPTLAKVHASSAEILSRTSSEVFQFSKQAPNLTYADLKDDFTNSADSAQPAMGASGRPEVVIPGLKPGAKGPRVFIVDQNGRETQAVAVPVQQPARQPASSAPSR